MTTTRLPYTDYYLTIMRDRNSKWENNTSKLYYIKPHIKEWESAPYSCRQYEVKLRSIHIKHTRLTQGHLMSRNNQQPTCGNQSATIKHCLKVCPNAWRDSRKKHNMQYGIGTLIGKDCEVEKMISFPRQIGMFEEI